MGAITKKVLSSLSLMLIFSLSVPAQGQYLIVWRQSGSVVYFDLDQEPVTTFSDGMLHIKTKRVSVSYPLETVTKYTYQSPESGMDQTEGAITMTQRGDNITLTNLEAGTDVNVYSTDGTLIQTIRAGQSTTELNMEPMDSGVYLIKANGLVFKFLKQ